MEEQQENVALIAAEVETDAAVLEELRQRVAALESAIDEMRTQSAGAVAAAAAGRKTAVTLPAKESVAALDAALGSLSLEQRIAVKSHMLRNGLL